MLNDILGGTTYSRFLTVVVSNLVDSNVFIRSLVLSIEFFSPRQEQIKALGCRFPAPKLCQVV